MAKVVEFQDGLQESYQESVLGSGGKGQVFLSVDGRFVVKLFKPEDSANEQRHFAALEQIVHHYDLVHKHPYWSSLFSWPDRVAMRVDGRSCLGVRMAMINLPTLDKPLEYSHIAQYYHLLEPRERGWWIARVAIAMKLARAIAHLESNTLAHTDISAKNVLADPYTGRMVLIDCDGIVAPGTQLFAQVAGTPEYQAPELVSGRERAPTRYTDRHALAVLIYRLLLYRHPLKGPRRHPLADRVTAEQEDQYLWGDGALYIEDPHDNSNRPNGKIIPASTLGKRIEGLMNQAFVTGLHQPGARPLASEWENILTRLYDRIVPCANPDCVQRFFALPSRPGGLNCPMCGQGLSGPASVPYLRMRRLKHVGANMSDEWEDENDYLVIGWPGRVLHAWHLSTDVTPVPTDARPYDPRPMARFHYDRRTDTWYLTNEGMDEIVLNDMDLQIRQGESVPLEYGTNLRLGKSALSRLASVRVVPMSEGHATYRLPNTMIGPDEPWPTLVATQDDVQWQPGRPIARAVDSFNSD